MIINIQIRRKKASSPAARIVCGNTDYQIAFTFDSEWDAYTNKTARFIWNGQYADVVFSGNVCDVPKITDTTLCMVGVFAGDLHTTTPAYIKCDRSILCGEGSPAEPTDDVYAQIMEKLNDGGLAGPMGPAGPAGPVGPAGATGATGPRGDTGVGVESVTQTTTANADGGTNIVTVTLTDGTKSTFTVKNGSRGPQGPQGPAGPAGGGGSGGGGVTSWNDLEDKPFGKKREFCVLFPETALSVDADMGGAPLGAEVELAGGESYTVTWNGTAYESTAQEMVLNEDGVIGVVLGDIGALLGVESTGEPFVIMYAPDAFGSPPYGMVMPLDGSEAPVVKIEGVGTIVDKLDPIYLSMNNSYILNGEAEGSLRTQQAAPESAEYKLGLGAFAEGPGARASGYGAHAEGEATRATGKFSHAEGGSTYATGEYSHAEGRAVRATGNYSHAEGRATKASSDCQHVQGKYNIEDTAGKYAHIVGNGTDSPTGGNFSNAHTLDWDGNAWFAGTVEATAIILTSRTGSGKRFKLTVGDDGQLYCLEVTE